MHAESRLQKGGYPLRLHQITEVHIVAWEGCVFWNVSSARVQWQVPRAGQSGFHQRTEGISCIDKNKRMCPTAPQQRAMCPRRESRLRVDFPTMVRRRSWVMLKGAVSGQQTSCPQGSRSWLGRMERGFHGKEHACASNLRLAGCQLVKIRQHASVERHQIFVELKGSMWLS